MKIVELVCKPIGQTVPQVFTVGRVPLSVIGAEMEGMGIVSSIRYNRSGKLYNGGYQGEFPSYTVEFVDSDIRSIIPERQMARIGIDVEKNKKDDEAVPELPDN